MVRTVAERTVLTLSCRSGRGGDRWDWRLGGGLCGRSNGRRGSKRRWRRRRARRRPGMETGRHELLVGRRAGVRRRSPLRGANLHLRIAFREHGAGENERKGDSESKAHMI